MVLGHRVAALVNQVDFGAGHFGHALTYLVDAPLDRFAHFRRQRPHGAPEFGGLRDHVAGVAGMELADRDHGGVQGIEGPRDDRLQGGDQLRADQHGIDALVRARGVAAEPFDLDVDRVGRGHHRTGTDGKGADRNPRAIMHAVNLLDAEPVHQPVLDHGGGARTALLGRLEDHDRVAGEIPGLGKVSRCP